MLPIFRSDMQVRLLAALLLQPDRQWSLADLAATLGAPASSVHRELERAIVSGVVERDAERRPHRFSANLFSPLAAPLAALLRRTVGVESELRTALEPLPIDAAVVHGSWASGSPRPDSDIDLLVIGDVAPGQVRRRVRPVADRLGREIDVTVFGRDEFRRLVEERSGFARHVLEDVTSPVIGDVSTIVER